MKMFKILSLPLVVNYSRSIEEGVMAGNYSKVRSDSITSRNFFAEHETEIEMAELMLEIFAIDTKIRNVYETAFKHRGYRSATIRELLALGEKYPKLQRKFPIFALGSNFYGGYGTTYFPFLHSDRSGRFIGLRLGDLEVPRNSRFANVREK